MLERSRKVKAPDSTSEVAGRHIASMSDTLTLVLDGRVTLDDFAKAVAHFQQLVVALSREVAAHASIEWVVTGLQSGSATATVQGLGPEREVEVVVRAYEQVGQAMEQHRSVPFSPLVQREARSLASLIDGRIESIRFETDRIDALIRGPDVLASLSITVEGGFPQDAYGAVEGIVDTLSRRGGLRFTLYDSLFDKAVSCYLVPGYEEVMRNVWGRKAVVLGRIRRDALTGRPLSVRQITTVQTVGEGRRGDWRMARGAAPSAGGSTPEETIRAFRDA